jgi:hypothetical protein
MSDHGSFQRYASPPSRHSIPSRAQVIGNGGLFSALDTLFEYLEQSKDPHGMMTTYHLSEDMEKYRESAKELADVAQKFANLCIEADCSDDGSM